MTIHYVVYDTATGMVKRSGEIADGCDIADQAGVGESVLDTSPDFLDPNAWKVTASGIEAITPPDHRPAFAVSPKD